MTKELSDYEIEKQKKKQLLVRNEFLYQGKSAGEYDFPVIRKQNINIEKIKFLSYSDAKKNDNENKDKTIHFFTYDWKFKKVYSNPEEELEKLSQYYCLLSPDFSIFENMPKALQIESIFKNRWCGAYWQSKNLNVIPTVSWGDESTFDFCFDGIEKGSIVAVSTYYRENCEEEFMLGSFSSSVNGFALLTAPLILGALKHNKQYHSTPPWYFFAFCGKLCDFSLHFCLGMIK